MSSLKLETLWGETGFTPNERQRAAITHADGPLFLPAGPGSGKTRVLLWRTVNLIVFHGVKPEEIFLSTFTEKAAFQLKQGLQSLLGLVTNHTGTPYDLSPMYLGTVHSLCQRLIADRRFARDRQRATQPVLLDELDQYFLLGNTRNLKVLMDAARVESIEAVNKFFGDTFNNAGSSSKHKAVVNLMSLFNRFSEEQLDPDTIKARTGDPMLQQLIEMYAVYKLRLSGLGRQKQVDFSLLQQEALETLRQAPDAGHVFRHIIIDEYQDTNTIQEKLFFELAAGHGNICVVGDDDQALFRFRGATVENFVQFPHRCVQQLQRPPKQIPLSVNYRSRGRIVNFYTDFIERGDWRRADGKGHYRIADKNITAHSGDRGPSVVASTNGSSADVCAEIVGLVENLLAKGKVEDPSQIAFLFPSVKTTQAKRMKEALESAGLLVYAPRAGRFLEVDEAVAVFGVFLLIFGQPERGSFAGADYHEFHTWMDTGVSTARELVRRDKALARYIEERKAELADVLSDYGRLMKVVQENGWSLDEPYDLDRMARPLYNAPGLSPTAKKNFANRYFDRIIRERAAEGKPFALRYLINSATSLDWNVLDLFYRLCGFDHFKAMFDLAEKGRDEGPVCNLSLITEYLAKFLDKYTSIITAGYLAEKKFQRVFFQSYLYSLFRLGESEYEDADDPFPKGRIPFLTIHQSKGLEFPVVVLGTAGKKDMGPQFVEEKVRPLLDREGEPVDRISGFDIQRMFYVALSRAQNLMVIAHPRGRGITTHPHFTAMLDGSFPRIPSFDLSTVPVANHKEDEIPRTYSYTSDYLLFQKCPRQYMIFRKYGFAASRSQMQFFGNLVHSTIEDLHQFLIARRNQHAKEATV
jgi:DNA helicase II / ATP-dependent DNA helicase PcrA